MSSTLAPTLPGIDDPRALRLSLARAEKQRKLRAFALTLPLLRAAHRLTAIVTTSRR